MNVSTKSHANPSNSFLMVCRSKPQTQNFMVVPQKMPGDLQITQIHSLGIMNICTNGLGTQSSTC